ncbi:unnamed protein product [Prorocentrum cordatum]|uniref:Uncharacterized protein n=1 Tax=Prorocentrum cordatum TaxID=2364126 RepID=A0ABN9P8X2_9DINO|nr:unnamed protein product [Polarella glacialis]
MFGSGARLQGGRAHRTSMSSRAPWPPRAQARRRARALSRAPRAPRRPGSGAPLWPPGGLPGAAHEVCGARRGEQQRGHDGHLSGDAPVRGAGRAQQASRHRGVPSPGAGHQHAGVQALQRLQLGLRRRQLLRAVTAGGRGPGRGGGRSGSGRSKRSSVAWQRAPPPTAA